MKNLEEAIEAAKEMLEMKQDAQDFKLCAELEYAIRHAEEALSSGNVAKKVAMKRYIEELL